MKKYSLKKSIVRLLITFSLVISIIIGSVSLYSLYTSKVNFLNHNNKQILNYFKYDVNKFLIAIEKISIFVDNEYNGKSKFLDKIVELNNNIRSIIILNQKGVITDFSSSKNSNIYKGFDYSNKEYFTVINNNKKSSWSELFFSTVDETYLLSYSYKMKNNSVLILLIKLEDLLEFSKRFKNNDGSHMIRMFDKNGVVVLNPDFNDIVAQRFNAFSSSVFKDLINKVEPFEQTIFNSHTFKNESQIGMYVNIEQTGWKIVVREQYEYVLESLKFMIFIIVFILIIFLVLSILVSLNISKKVFSSLEDLKNSAFNIANGYEDKYIKESFYLEFDSVIQNFNKMKDEISKREDSLEDSLQSFMSLVDSTMEAIILHEGGVCKDANIVAVKLLGYKSKNEIIGKNYSDLFYKDSKDFVLNNLDIDTNPCELEILKKDGTTFTSLGQGKSLRLSNRKIKVSTFIDLTELKQKEMILFQQSKMASMGEMIANIAHQWRQPLSTISTAASGIKLQKEFDILTDIKLNESMDVIVSSTQHLSKTIDDFRNFFSLDKEFKKLDIIYSIKKNLKLMDATFKSTHVKIIEEYEESIYIMGYENELVQALINIFKNSKDALEKSKVEEKYIFIKTFKDKNKVYISIKDNAGGIPKDIINKIFEPYFTTKHKSQGTGIGLYMTHQIIVDHMKGKIDVVNSKYIYESIDYKGAEFIISFNYDKKLYNNKEVSC